MFTHEFFYFETCHKVFAFEMKGILPLIKESADHACP